MTCGGVPAPIAQFLHRLSPKRSIEIRFEADLKPLIRRRPLAFVYLREPDFRAYIAWEAKQDGGVISVEYDPATTNVPACFSKANCRSIVARALGIGEGSFRVLGTHHG
jgi:hypothetical protein